MRKIALHLLVFMLLATPLAAFAAGLTQPSAVDQGGLVPCDGSDCDWSSLVVLAQNVLNFIIYIGILAAAGLFMYAGFLYMTAAGDGSKVTKAKGIFFAIVIGLIIILTAWLIVNTLLAALTGKGLKERQPSGVIDQTSLLV